jgi:hypothetical protein
MTNEESIRILHEFENPPYPLDSLYLKLITQTKNNYICQ